MVTTTLQPVSAPADDARVLFWEPRRLPVQCDAAVKQHGIVPGDADHADLWS